MSQPFTASPRSGADRTAAPSSLLSNSALPPAPQVIEVLVAAGAEIESISKEGATPLGLAVHENRTDAEVVLRAAGSSKVSGEAPTKHRVPKATADGTAAGAAAVGEGGAAA
jgi:hypothetical protein